MNFKYDKKSLVFQLAKRSRIYGITGKFISSAAKYNRQMLASLTNFVQGSLEYFVKSDLLSSVFHQIASNALSKVQEDVETEDIMRYLDEWVERASAYKKTEADEYFCKVYSYDIYMGDLDSKIVYQKLKELKK